MIEILSKLRNFNNYFNFDVNPVIFDSVAVRPHFALTQSTLSLSRVDSVDMESYLASTKRMLTKIKPMGSKTGK
jgi:hypothetical protein